MKIPLYIEREGYKKAEAAAIKGYSEYTHRCEFTQDGTL
jgi:hypothetical protein